MPGTVHDHPFARRNGLVVAFLLTAAAFSGCTTQSTPPENAPANQSLPGANPGGVSIPLHQSALTARVWSPKGGGGGGGIRLAGVPLAAYTYLEQHATDGSLMKTLADRGWVGAILTDDELAAFERLLVELPPAQSKETPPSAAGAAASAAPKPDSKPSTPSAEATPSKPAEPVPTASPAVELTTTPVPMGAIWSSILDGPSRSTGWALALGSTTARIAPTGGTLRLFARCWPVPIDGDSSGDAVEAMLRVQLVPVIVTPRGEPGVFGAPTLPTDLAAKGLVLSRHAVEMNLRAGSSLVLLPLRHDRSGSTRVAGPDAEGAPTVGEAFLRAERGTDTDRVIAARVMVLTPTVSATYHLGAIDPRRADRAQ